MFTISCNVSSYIKYNDKSRLTAKCVSHLCVFNDVLGIFPTVL